MAEGNWRNHLEVEGDGLMRIRRHDSMKVDAMIVADSEHLSKSTDDRSISQLVNIASMPGVVGEAWAMADWHFGYGFPIGGVLATDVNWGDEGGSISPGGVGFDINCGVRMVALECSIDDIPNIDKLAGRLNGRIPSGGSGKGGLDISRNDLSEIISRGSNAMVDLGYAYSEDLENIESNGVLETDEGVSERAMARGMKALGTLGSGNHFLELQTVQSIEEENPHNLFEGQVVCMIHSGSRGLGHQVCTDHVRTLEDKYRNRGGTWHNDDWGFEIQDRQLAAAPIHSKEGQQYLDAMNGAANFAFANRSALTHRLRQTLAAEFEVETKLLYDVSHNIAKIEDHIIDGKKCT
ncbi:MAG: RNA-splicing ligase RtcB, partial [Phycisphaerae bacterium]|nr:RNA-splicing ligase RtcB [Phycisphaerae bacterium]